MGAQEAPEAASVMAVLPWGMLCTAVSYPVSDSLESHTACPSWCFFLQSESIFPTNILSLPVCKLLIPSPCKPLVAHMSPSLAWSLWCPSGKSIGLSCCPLQRRGSSLVSLQTSAFLSRGCFVLCQCVSSGVS